MLVVIVYLRIQSNGRFGLVPSLSSIHGTLMGLILAWGEGSGFWGQKWEKCEGWPGL